MSIKADDFTNSITAILNNYTEEIANNVIQIAGEVSDEAIEKLAATSPKDNRETVHYATQWKKKRITFKTATAVRYKIYNKEYQLTHLLEYGHITRNGDRTIEQPHIKPVEEWAVEEFEKRVKEAAKG